MAAPKDPSVIQEMRAEADGDVTVTTSPATDEVRLRQRQPRPLPVRAHRQDRDRRGCQGRRLRRQVRQGVRYDARPGSATARPPRPRRVTPSTSPRPTRACRSSRPSLRAHVDNQGDLTSVSGYVAPNLNLDVTPRLDEAAAKAKAVKSGQPGARRRRRGRDEEAEGLRPVGDEGRPRRLPDGRHPGRRGPQPPRLGRRGDRRQAGSRDQRAGREDGQAGQPLLDDRPRPQP
ncbi:hypothetical protein G5V59_02090 [Nocardioides sp. W3-2-3]|uniref:hypothetical protein n=1 Tax=Nocardioides convexus TaxID=2712224 RepID=UPI00241840BA|nr:hypothetical protein [Nocardioides convexus]NGZ99579.1 hypothetical protein [Nocardioides convexus]